MRCHMKSDRAGGQSATAWASPPASATRGLPSAAEPGPVGSAQGAPPSSEEAKSSGITGQSWQDARQSARRQDGRHCHRCSQGTAEPATGWG